MHDGVSSHVAEYNSDITPGEAESTIDGDNRELEIDPRSID